MKLLHNKKAIGGGMGGPRQPISGLLGVIFLILGVIPLLNTFGILGFTIPITPVGLILWILATIGGLVLVWDALTEKMPTGIESQLRMASLLGALILLAIGVIPILNSFGVIGFSLPELADILKNILFTVVGVLLLYGATKQF